MHPALPSGVNSRHHDRMLLTEIDHVAIAVNDLEGAIEYYRSTYGCEVEHRETIEKDGETIEIGVPEQMRSMAAMIIPLGRPAQPEEAAGPVLFLCSPLANYVHGQVLNVTGGQFGGMFT